MFLVWLAGLGMKSDIGMRVQHYFITGWYRRVSAGPGFKCDKDVAVPKVRQRCRSKIGATKMSLRQRCRGFLLGMGIAESARVVPEIWHDSCTPRSRITVCI